ncbi:heteromeric transposase endonuclease subunit TnsA [Desulforamulus aeronauticus]|uniref:TnsA endonuclease C terminal n=1 Tax=Desulforamulus aeronauticus DSM 10349 TaxID=1121421 RepID=A0A1M6QFZ5_9FIRM|nr:heteromeric transposase endonuclease subunit TnsA [Desulforamulus aeronauticus]SHK19131.1 TnsA endonuclease C terminal [Desulforamulus aeronauticus DSM 10349]
MAKYTWDEQRYKRYLREGRGQGEGKNYKPWIKVQDFPSKGWSTKAPGWKSNRLHHFMSQLELQYFYLLEWSDVVIDIREQYPLLDFSETEKISEELGIKYPTDRETGFPIVSTTDFLITVLSNGNKVNIARTVKPSTELDKRRVIEKFEIERRYWAARNINWGIVTEKEIPLTMVKNVEWLHDAHQLVSTCRSDIQELTYVTAVLKERLSERIKPTHEILRELDHQMKLEKGTSLYVLKHLIAQKQIIVDMSKELKIGQIVVEEVIVNPQYGVMTS